MAKHIHAEGTFWGAPDIFRLGPFETVKEAEEAARSWLNRTINAKEVWLFNRVTPLFSVRWDMLNATPDK